MGFKCLVMFCWFFVGLVFIVTCDAAAEEVTVKLLKTPRAITNQNAAKFAFEILVGSNGNACTNCTTNCKLNDHLPLGCESGEVTYARLKDGNHTFEVCTKGVYGVVCSSYTWIVDTVPPTAFVAAAKSFTNETNISVNVSFSESCSGLGGFQCTSVDSCNVTSCLWCWPSNPIHTKHYSAKPHIFSHGEFVFKCSVWKSYTGHG